MDYQKVQSVGVILSGGQSSRMQFHDKALLALGNKRVIDYVFETFHPQVDQLVINANRHLDQYQSLAVPVLTDDYGPKAGPIAGIVTAMAWAKHKYPNLQHIVCCPGDVPWFPDNTVEILIQALQSNACDASYLCTDGQWQPLFSAWSINTFAALEKAIDEGLYSPMALLNSLPNAMVSLNHCKAGDFANLNTPEDLQMAQDLLKPA